MIWIFNALMALTVPSKLLSVAFVWARLFSDFIEQFDMNWNWLESVWVDEIINQITNFGLAWTFRLARKSQMRHLWLTFWGWRVAFEIAQLSRKVCRLWLNDISQLSRLHGQPSLANNDSPMIWQLRNLKIERQRALFVIFMNELKVFFLCRPTNVLDSTKGEKSFI